MKYIVGKIVRIISKYSVIVDKGLNDGVKEGMEGIIYEDLGPIKTDYGTELGNYTFRKGEIVVKQAEPDFSIVSTPVRYTETMSIMKEFMGLSSPKQKELDVDDKDIKPLIEKGTEKVKVGDLVRIYINE